MKRYSQGFAVFEFLVIIVAVGLIGAVGYFAYTNFSKANDQASVSVTKEADIPQKIESVEDIDKASSSLDNLNISDSDSTKFDKATANF